MSSTLFDVTGMTCQHCVTSVTSEVSKVPGVEHVAELLFDQFAADLHGRGQRSRLHGEVVLEQREALLESSHKEIEQFRAGLKAREEELKVAKPGAAKEPEEVIPVDDRLGELEKKLKEISGRRLKSQPPGERSAAVRATATGSLLLRVRESGLEGKALKDAVK